MTTISPNAPVEIFLTLLPFLFKRTNLIQTKYIINMSRVNILYPELKNLLRHREALAKGRGDLLI